jgi:flagellar hook-basal body complex protein FliE
MDVSSFSRAAGAYQDALRVAQNIVEKANSSAGMDDTKETQGSSFMSYLGNALQSSEKLGYKSEHLATKALSGKADLTDVVTAVSDAETALDTVTAIRDRVISAYQDIIKMPI